MMLTALFILAAQPAGWTTGPVIADFGPTTPVETDMPIPQDRVLAPLFDAAEMTETHESRTLVSAARFLNMHVAAGHPVENIRPAVVVHGEAVFALVSDARFAEKYDDADANPNAALVRALVDAGVQIVVCGQSAAGQDVAKADLLPGVQMALSAMTAHALLQQEGYTLNPF